MVIMKTNKKNTSNLYEILKKQALLLVIIIGIILFAFNSIQILVETNTLIQEETVIYRASVEEDLKYQVNNAISIIEAIQQTHEEYQEGYVKDYIVAILESIELENNSYFFGADYEGNTVLGPGKGNNYYDIEDRDGLKVVQELIKAAQSGGGFVEYTMPPVEEVEQKPKISYVLPVEKYEWYVGTGIEYDVINNVESEIKSDMIQQLIVNFILLVVLIGMVVAIAYIFNKRLYSKIFSHISRLIEKIQGATNTEARIPIESFTINELRIIASETQDLIDKRKEQADLLQKQIQDENQRLEVLVEERTRDLEKTTRELMESERLASLGRLVAGVAHEINTPLGVSISACSFLADNNDRFFEKVQGGKFSKSEFVNYMKSVDDSTAILLANITKASELVKRFKRISVDQSAELSSRFDLKKYIEELFYTLKHEYKNKNVQIDVQSDEKIVIDSYPGVISQIFTNLLMNSLIHGFEYDDEQAINRVLVSLSFMGNDIVISYSDNGKGLSDEVKKHIFEPFYSTKHGTGGTGLGMHIVFNLVTEILGGTIVIEDVLEEGARFIITLPRKGDENHE